MFTVDNDMNRNLCTHVTHEDLLKTLATPATQGAKQLEPFKSFSVEHGLPFAILEDHAVRNDAEVHMEMADLWVCLEGNVTFIVDGELKEPKRRLNADGSENEKELYATEIVNGRTIEFRPGDWLWIPAGQPHQHMCDGTVRMMIIKIPSPRPIS